MLLARPIRKTSPPRLASDHVIDVRESVARSRPIGSPRSRKVDEPSGGRSQVNRLGVRHDETSCTGTGRNRTAQTEAPARTTGRNKADRSAPESVIRSLDHVIGVRIPASQPLTHSHSTTCRAVETVGDTVRKALVCACRSELGCGVGCTCDRVHDSQCRDASMARAGP